MLYLASRQERREKRTRAKIKGSGRHRLSVFRSGRYIYAQLIDDSQQRTVCSASSIEKEGRSALKSTNSVEAARWVGERIGKKALEIGVDSVVFDRGLFRYHGRIKALADAARDAGLKF
jgi:large subunit ribosomal protein L18